jgi:mediator of RNA polymerase II transcription subunit 10
MASAAAPVERIIEKLLAQIFELEQTLASYAPEQHARLLPERLAALMAGVQALRDAASGGGGAGAASALSSVRVPEDLLAWVDAGGHPDAYVQRTFEDARRDNQMAKGRVKAVAALRAALLEAAREARPAAVEAYERAAGGGGGAAAGAGGGNGGAAAGGG